MLEAQGLIKTRTGPGGGSFVHEVSRQRAKALLGNYFYFKDLTIGDIYQLRADAGARACCVTCRQAARRRPACLRRTSQIL